MTTQRASEWLDVLLANQRALERRLVADIPDITGGMPALFAAGQAVGLTRKEIVQALVRGVRRYLTTAGRRAR